MKTDSKKTIIHAILWAAAMIGSAIIMRGSDRAEEIFLLMLVLASTSLLTQGKPQNELRCLWRKVTGAGRAE
ncbi:hypothetical protein [Kordiimonas aestuarii]|uniref:hypothetical protein n=1 Tax=Kordiimonas aestuarii TaxID=1005925 RepID=UPI0021D078BD|nr:hypothetical protein [Kordiimonas aestuarii]